MHRRSFVGSMVAAPAWILCAQAPEHPRLFLDANRIAALREAIRTTHARLWTAVRADADSFASRKPPAYPTNPGVNDEQLWQREVGNTLPFLAIACLLTGEARYLDAAVQWSLASCGYPTWGTGIRDGVDLAAGHQLFGLALVYDWLQDRLPVEARDQIRRTLLARGAAMFNAARETAFWKNSVLQNHLWVNLTGLIAAAMALDEPDTAPWIKLAREKFQATEANLGPDGASHEGVGYWSYGVEYMLKYWHLAGSAFGDKPHSPWWNNTAAYRLYMGLPRNAWASGNVNIDIADSPRSAWYGPDYMLRRLASINYDPCAQWLAGELDRAGLTTYSARWLNLLWFDPAIAERTPGKLPPMRHFEDMGIVSARTSWTGDEALLVFKCGPPLGHQAVGKFDYNPGAGHVHPDANHFVLFGSGEWLLRDDGYAWKQTGQHNTLLLDGAGQLGEGSQWFRGIDPIRSGARPRVLKAAPGLEFDEIAGDAASIYPAAAGLKRYVRRLLFWKPNIVIVLDEIDTVAPKQLELRFHPEFASERDNEGFLASGRKAALRIELLTPAGVTQSHGTTAGKNREGKATELFAVRFNFTGSRWRNVVALSWSEVGGTPPRVTVERKENFWVFRSGKRQLSYSL